MKFWGFFYGDDEEMTDEERRKKHEDLRRRFPDVFPDPAQERIIQQVVDTFNQGCFGIVSACKSGRSKKKNLESHLQLAHEIRDLGLRYIAQIGFWDEIWDRSLFIPEIEKKLLHALAQRFGQKSYIWGEQGYWCCHATKSDQIIAGGDALKMIGLDKEFMLYSKIDEKKSYLNARVAAAKKKYRPDNKHLSKTIAVLRRQLKDLETIERDLIGF